MKVLHLIDSAGVYGAENVLLALAAVQTERGMDVTLGAIVQKHEPERAIEAHARQMGIPVRRLETRTGFHPGSIFDAISFLRSYRADIVHAHGFKADVLAALVPKHDRTFGLVTTLHGWTATDKFSRLRVYEDLDRLALRRMDVVVPVAGRIGRHRALACLSNVIVVPNGVASTPDAMPATSDDLLELMQYCARGPTILSVGRLSREKNQQALLRAVAALRSSDVNVQILLVGEGELRGELNRAAAALGLQDRVLMAGYVPAAHRLFKHARALVITSLTEGLPISILEAMRDRLPVIATPVGDVPEVLGDTCGWLVGMDDDAALAEALNCVLAGAPEVDRKSCAAHARWSQRYSVQRMFDGYAEAYRVALNRLGFKQSLTA